MIRSPSSSFSPQRCVGWHVRPLLHLLTFLHAAFTHQRWTTFLTAAFSLINAAAAAPTVVASSDLSDAFIGRGRQTAGAPSSSICGRTNGSSIPIL